MIKFYSFNLSSLVEIYHGQTLFQSDKGHMTLIDSGSTKPDPKVSIASWIGEMEHKQKFYKEK